MRTPIRVFSSVPRSKLPTNRISPNKRRSGLVFKDAVHPESTARVNETIRSLAVHHKQGKRAGVDYLCSVIKFFEKRRARMQGKQLHGHLTAVGFNNDTFFFNHLISMYGKCGFLDEARSVFDLIRNKNLYSWNTLIACYCKAGHLCEARVLFDEMPERDSVSWNLMISGYDRFGPCEEALRIFRSMRRSGAVIDHFGLSGAVSACCNLRFSVNGRSLHSYSMKIGLCLDVHVGSAIVELYAKCMLLSEARRVFDSLENKEQFTWNSMLSGYVYGLTIDQALQFFDEMLEKDVVSWTIIVEGCSYHNLNREAINFFWKMRKCGIQADQAAFVSVLDACVDLLNLEDGFKVHCLTIKCGYETDVSVGSVLVSLYAKCGNFSDSTKVTEGMHIVDDFSWSVLISEYAKHGLVGRSQVLFESIPVKSLAIWNALITGYSDLGMFEEAFRAFKELYSFGHKGDAFTYGSILAASDSFGLRYGEQLHSQIRRTGLCSSFFVCGALIDMYFCFNHHEAAERIFQEIDGPNVVLWNVMIYGYGQKNLNYEAMQLFWTMRCSDAKPDNVTLSCTLDACSNISALVVGVQIHAHSHKIGLGYDVIVGSAIVDMYAKCREIGSATLSFSDILHPNVISWTALLGGYVKCGIWDKAKSLFASMPEKNVVSWNVMLSGYIQQEFPWDALNLYFQMNRVGIWPDRISFISSLTACCKLLLKEQGRQVHAQIIKTGYYMNAYVGLALTSMYQNFGMETVNQMAY